MRRLRTAGIGLSLAVALACAPPPPRGTPSNDQSAFAEEYPVRLHEVRTSFAARAEAVKSSLPSIRALPGELNAESSSAAAEVVRRADAAGRSSYYVEEALAQEGIARFLTEERAGVRRRIAGAVAFAAKERECTQDDANALGSSAASAAERAFQRELEQRLHHRNEAIRLIDARRERLEARDVPTLEKQADAIAWSSYLTHVRLELYRQELEELVAQQENVRATLDRARADSQAALESGKLRRARRAALEQRLAAFGTARAAVDKELPPAEQELETLGDELAALQKQYGELIAEVVTELEQRAASSGAAPDATVGPPASDRNADPTGATR